MTDDVAGLVLEDNRLQTLALSIMENDGALSLPSYVRAIEIFETAGRLDRSEEHTSELQSLMRISYAVFCLTKKNTSNTMNTKQSFLIYIQRIHDTNLCNS